MPRDPAERVVIAQKGCYNHHELTAHPGTIERFACEREREVERTRGSAHDHSKMSTQNAARDLRASLVGCAPPYGACVCSENNSSVEYRRVVLPRARKGDAERGEISCRVRAQHARDERSSHCRQTWTRRDIATSDHRESVGIEVGPPERRQCVHRLTSACTSAKYTCTSAKYGVLLRST